MILWIKSLPTVASAKESSLASSTGASSGTRSWTSTGLLASPCSSFSESSIDKKKKVFFNIEKIRAEVHPEVRIFLSRSYHISGLVAQLFIPDRSRCRARPRGADASSFSAHRHDEEMCPVAIRPHFHCIPYQKDAKSLCTRCPPARRQYQNVT